MNREAERLAAESRLEAAGARREALEKELEEVRETVDEEIHKCARLGSKKTTIAAKARLDRSRIYQLLPD